MDNEKIMAKKTITRSDLAEALYHEIGLSRTECNQLVVAILDHISEALLRGETVKLARFGTFSFRDKSARIGRNPKTREIAEITPRRVLSFKPSDVMRDQVISALKS